MKFTVTCVVLVAIFGTITHGEVLENEFVARFDNYRVYNVKIESIKQLELLKELESTLDGFQFWESPNAVGTTVKLQVPPHKFSDLGDLIKLHGLNVELAIKNLQEAMDNVQPKVMTRAMDWTAYNTLDEIYEWLDVLAVTYPNVVTRITGGESFENRKLEGVKVSFKAGNKGVFLEGGIHAREWISVAAMTYILNQLLTSTDPEVRSIAENFDWYVFPVTNPDGYVFTHTSNRNWRKTRQPHGTGICVGADPNRNWGYRWNTGGASNVVCAETYAGPNAFSEPEVASLAEYYTSIKDNIMVYISFHSFSQLLLIPFGHTPDPLLNYDDAMTIGTAAINRLRQRHGTEYQLGNIAEAIYVATGGSIDWIRGDQDTQLAYTYELRDLGTHGFLLPADQIIPTGEETLDSLVALLAEAERLGY